MFSLLFTNSLLTSCQDDNQVRLYSTTSGQQTQGMRHPRPVVSVVWRYSSLSRRFVGIQISASRANFLIHSGDPTLFTITSDSVLRLFLPVVDSPQRLQLHLAVDILAPPAPPAASQPMQRPESEIIWLDKEIVGAAVKTVLKASETKGSEMLRLRDVEEDWDLFLRVLADGSLLLSAVAVSDL